MNTQHQDVYIVAAQRTPVGKAPNGCFHSTRPDDLLAHAITAALHHCPELDPQQLDDVIVGCAMPEAAQGLNVARMSALLAGVPENVPGVTINRFCASGLQAIAWAADRIRLGEAEVMVAAGVESMSHVPMGGNQFVANPRWFSDENIGIAYGMGLTAERVAQRWHISREAQDAFAIDSHRKAAQAIDHGWFDTEITPYRLTQRQPSSDGQTVLLTEQVVMQDEGVRREMPVEKVAQLPTVFATQGSVTAANSSQISDGAAALVLMSESLLTQLDMQPLARFRGYHVAGVAPNIMGIGPVAAVPPLLAKAGLNRDELDWIELNEAFAAQSLAVIDELELNPEVVNPCGGAIALGHPLGATGAIRAATLLHGLQRTGKRWGLVTMCVGTGMGAAGLFERV